MSGLPVKRFHKASLISKKGVSALCFQTPRKINLKRALWTLIDKAVTCPKCKAALKGQASKRIGKISITRTGYDPARGRQIKDPSLEGEQK